MLALRIADFWVLAVTGPGGPLSVVHCNAVVAEIVVVLQLLLLELMMPASDVGWLASACVIAVSPLVIIPMTIVLYLAQPQHVYISHSLSVQLAMRSILIS